MYLPHMGTFAVYRMGHGQTDRWQGGQGASAWVTLVAVKWNLWDQRGLVFSVAVHCTQLATVLISSVNLTVGDFVYFKAVSTA